MRTSAVFALFAFAAGKQQQEQAQQGDDAAAAPQQGDGSANYGDAAPSYAAPTYEPASAPAYAPAESYAQPVKCCVRRCPEHAPYFSLQTCGCHAGIMEVQSYAQSYAQPETSYGQSYGQQQASSQSGYRVLNEIAPKDTIDTRDNHVTRAGRISLWVGFAILFISAYWFLSRAWDFHKGASSSDASKRQYAFLTGPGMAGGFVCLIAALAYLTMATNNGYYTRCSDGRQFYYARYIDWVLTTPIMLHGLCHFANAADDTFMFIFFMDVLMIISGLIASTVESSNKWFFFGFSMLCFIPIMHQLCRLRESVVNLNFDSANWFWNYANIANLTIAAWFFYPIIWICAEGTDVLSSNGEAIAYTVLDVIAKAVMGWFIITAEPMQALTTAGWLDDAAKLAAFNDALEKKLTSAGHSVEK